MQQWSISIGSVLLFILCMLPGVAHAELQYSVTPRVIDVEKTSRDIEKRTITITNTGQAPITVFPTVNEIMLDEGGDVADFVGPTMVDRTRSITSWLEIVRNGQRVDPGESKELTLTIRMNPNAEPGEYHALLGFGAGKNRIIAEAMVEKNQAPTIVVTIRVPDNKVELVDLEGFIVEKFVTSNDNQAITYTLTNPGDTRVVPLGEIIIYDGNGKEITSINANPEKRSLDPGQEIQLTAHLPIRGMLGRHKAFLDVKYGGGQTASVYDTAFFYVLPWKTLLIIFLLFAAVAITVTLYLHRRFELGTAPDDDKVQTLSFRVTDSTSDDKEHDINLKSTDQD